MDFSGSVISQLARLWVTITNHGDLLPWQDSRLLYFTLPWRSSLTGCMATTGLNQKSQADIAAASNAASSSPRRQRWAQHSSWSSGFACCALGCRIRSWKSVGGCGGCSAARGRLLLRCEHYNRRVCRHQNHVKHYWHLSIRLQQTSQSNLLETCWCACFLLITN